jgi:tetratricopeptide (TPR) repeat protein
MDPNSAPGTPSNGASTRGIPDGRRRRIALIAALALAAGIAAAAGVLLLGGDDGAGQEAASGKPLAGQPLLVLDLPGKPLPAHASAQQALATAEQRLPAGDPRISIGRAVASYDRSDPLRTIDALRAMSADDPAVALNLGLVEAWSGDTASAAKAWRRAKELDQFGYYGTIADNLLHPEQTQNYPPYFPPHPFGKGTVAQLRAAAERHPDQAARWLALAVALQQDDRAAALAAARRAAELDPTGISSRVALVVLGYDKDRPSDAFGRLGPLLSQSDDPDGEIRFHIALLSLWFGLRDKAAGEFRQVLREHPDGGYARLARAFVQELER